MENGKVYIDQLIRQSKAAQQILETYNQEQVDAIVRAIGKVIYDNAEDLTREASNETKMQSYESMVFINRELPLVHWNFLKGKKSVGVIENDTVHKVVTIAKPMGVFGCLTPSTNPIVCSMGNSMNAIKSRNSIIVVPHPRGKNVSLHSVQLMREAIKKLNGPEDIIQIIPEPTMELTITLLKDVDAVIATGGHDMVKVAYSSGRPSLGVGQGNAQVIVDREYGDYNDMAASIIGNRTLGNGSGCIGEQTLIVPREEQDDILKAFKAAGAFIVDDEATINRIRKRVFINGAINKDYVGQRAVHVAKMLEIDVPENTKLLMVKLDKFGKDEILCKEIMFPIIRTFAYDKFEDGIAIAKANLLYDGAGHSSTVYSHHMENTILAANALPVGRVMINQTNGGSAGITYFNGLEPTVSIGCGTWGNNSISENLTYKHMMNLTKVAYRIDDPYEPTPEEIWG